MACSRMPKCSTRPYQSAVKSSVEIDGGPNDFDALDGGVVAAGEVGRAAPQFGQLRARRR